MDRKKKINVFVLFGIVHSLLKHSPPPSTVHKQTLVEELAVVGS